MLGQPKQLALNHLAASGVILWSSEMGIYLMPIPHPKLCEIRQMSLQPLTNPRTEWCWTQKSSTWEVKSRFQSRAFWHCIAGFVFCMKHRIPCEERKASLSCSPLWRVTLFLPTGFPASAHSICHLAWDQVGHLGPFFSLQGTMEWIPQKTDSGYCPNLSMRGKWSVSMGRMSNLSWLY